MPDADPTSESPRRRDTPTRSHMPHNRPPPRQPQPPRAPTGRGDARSRTGRPGGPCSRAPPALLGPQPTRQRREHGWGGAQTLLGSSVSAVRKDGGDRRGETRQRIHDIPQEIEARATSHEYLVTGRHRQPLISRIPPPQVYYHRAVPTDHADLIQPAEFRGAARPRNRLRERRPLGQLVQVGLTHLACHRHRELGLKDEFHALFIGNENAAQPFSHRCQGRSRNLHRPIQGVDQRAIRGDRKVATHFGVAPHSYPKHVTRAQHRIPEYPSLRGSGRQRSDKQRSNDPAGAEAQPTFPLFFTRHPGPPCGERAESVARTVLARVRERRCCGVATDGRGCRAPLKAWHMPPVTRKRRPAGVLNGLSKVAFACLWCFVVVLPWDVYAELPVVGSIPRLVGIVASTIGVLYIGARRRVRPLSWFHVFTVVFVLWAAVSTLWSIDTEATRTRLLTYLQLTVLVWLIWEIAWSPQRTRALLGAYVLGVAVASVATIRDYLSGEHAAGYAGRFNALSINPNELGMTLAIGLPMAWYLSLSHPQRRVARLWQLYLPLAITAILLTASGGAFLTMLVALAIIPATQGRLRLRTKAALCVLAPASLVLAASFVPEATLERLQTTRADIESGYFGHRGFIWRAGLEVAREHPLVGLGAGTFGAAVEPTLGFQWSSHSVPLGILVEDGLVGLLVFLAIIGAAFTALRRAPRLPRRFGIVLLVALGVGSLSLEWGYRKQFWFVLGIVAAEAALRPRPQDVIDLGSAVGSPRPRAAVRRGLAADQ